MTATLPGMQLITYLSGALLMAMLSSTTLADDGRPNIRCEDDLVCISEIETASGVDLVAHNLADFPVSLSVYAKTRNYDVEPDRSLARVMEAGEKMRVMQLQRRRNDASGSLRYWFDWSPGRLDAAHNDDYLYRLPYQAGKNYRVLQGFGSRFSHKGINRYAVDFGMRTGTPVHAARAGRVVLTEDRHNKGCWEDGCGKYANFIVVLHDDGTTGEYYHLQKNGVSVTVNQLVRVGQLIGYSGNTGHTTTPHLHFAVYRPGTWGKFESLPIRFRSQEGVVQSPRSGGRYTAE